MAKILRLIQTMSQNSNNLSNETNDQNLPTPTDNIDENITAFKERGRKETIPKKSKESVWTHSSDHSVKSSEKTDPYDQHSEILSQIKRRIDLPQNSSLAEVRTKLLSVRKDLITKVDKINSRIGNTDSFERGSSTLSMTSCGPGGFMSYATRLNQIEVDLCLTQTKDDPLPDSHLEVIKNRLNDFQSQIELASKTLYEIQRYIDRLFGAEKGGSNVQKTLAETIQKREVLQTSLSTLKFQRDRFKFFHDSTEAYFDLLSLYYIEPTEDIAILKFTENIYFNLKKAIEKIASAIDSSKKELLQKYNSDKLFFQDKIDILANAIAKKMETLPTRTRNLTMEQVNEIIKTANSKKYTGRLECEITTVDSIPLPHDKYLKSDPQRSVRNFFNMRDKLKNALTISIWINNQEKCSTIIRKTTKDPPILICDFKSAYLIEINVKNQGRVVAMCFIKISDAAILFNGFAVNFPLYPSGTILAKLKVSGITVESANQLENVVFKRKHKIRVDRVTVMNFAETNKKPNYRAITSIFASEEDRNSLSLSENDSKIFFKYSQTLKSSDLPELFIGDDYKIITGIGRGNFGKLFAVSSRKNLANSDSKPVKGKNKTSKPEFDYFAIKCVKKMSLLQRDEVDNVFFERDVLKRVRDFPFMCKLQRTFQDEFELYFVMEFYAGGDLITHLQIDRFTLDQIRYYSSVIVLCLEFLHRNDIIYRDLKMDNICLTADGVPHLIDFGLSKMDFPIGSTTTTFCGTFPYLPPEMLKLIDYDHSIDFWELGVMIFVMFFRSNPFNSQDDDELAEMICTMELKFYEAIDESLGDLIHQLMTKAPENRIGNYMRGGPDQIKEHNFFSSIDWDNLASNNIAPPFVPNVGTNALENFPAEYAQAHLRRSTLDLNQDVNFLTAKNHLFQDFDCTLE